MIQKLFILVCFFTTNFIIAQSSTYVADDGIIRWKKNKEEVCLFGTNYSVPFAYWDYRAELIGNNQEEAIDEDVYHISRLGLDGFRIHVQENYISDEFGNLTFNRHLQLFDYLLFKLKKRGIKLYITPMYLNEAHPSSFNTKYGKSVGCLSNEAAFTVQENYLKQFVNHVNPYTGIAYKNDPDIVAFEIVNEPKHFKAPKLVKEYINTMYDAIRSTGCDVPLMYNMTTCVDFIDDVLASKVNGGSFQWYPTGLTANQTLKGNFLPNVDQYLVPFNQQLKEQKRPKFIYEFSPADTDAPYLYPAMARSFREAGFQFAAHFAYDPLHQAHANIEYKTHFLNLAYTPAKAIGLKIASEVFHQIPMYKTYGRFPKNNQFEDITLSHQQKLAFLNTDEKYFYTNTVKQTPKNIKKLKEIAGVGNSPIVEYSGNGAYFLEKIAKGVWRFEVMPDAFWVKDPFFVPYTKGESAVTLSRQQKVRIKLKDLGENFIVKGINKGNLLDVKADVNQFRVEPGVYIVSKKGIENKYNPTDTLGNIQLGEFYMPTRKPYQDYLLHKSPVEVSLTENLKLSAKIISEEKPEQVELILLSKGKGEVVAMNKIDEYSYEAQLPAKYTNKPQIIRYYISYKLKGVYVSYPGNNQDVYLGDRRIYTDDLKLDDSEPYYIRVVEPDNPVYLFNATTDWESIIKMKRSDVIPVSASIFPSQSKINFRFPSKKVNADEFAFRFYCGDKVKARKNDIIKKNKIIIYGQAKGSKAQEIEIQLLMEDGTVYSSVVSVGNQLENYTALLSDFKKSSSILIPRPYPKFQAYDLKSESKTRLNIQSVASIQLILKKSPEFNSFSKNTGVNILWIACSN
ncbi:hypothetical protein FHR24_001286 [Wenyingzhuangia heitensis]|uniref:Cellulase (Glycosyl hydrolase family 5) n=1 Tax=Wenyingzhuangia heitensis TaxID=1487859 RepID=A0ABX0U7Q6_9FLAO|nr:cellulase family glycosylhydrolase [Wenyingzhuangia heitensis]NIJ44847.1 hypothetical protein [Wenyingzhuangia heitensis]